jgi:hypothetical protein
LNEGRALLGVVDEEFDSLDGEETTADFEGKRSTRAEGSSNAGSVLAFDSILLRTPSFGGLVATVGLCGEMNKSDKSLVILGVENLGLFVVVSREGMSRVPGDCLGSVSLSLQRLSH